MKQNDQSHAAREPWAAGLAFAGSGAAEESGEFGSAGAAGTPRCRRCQRRGGLLEQQWSERFERD